MRTKANKAFTLAEVLVTLAIIGVIAAMAVPTLLQTTNDAELKTAWKKQFATLSQAAMTAMQEEGTMYYGGNYSSGDYQTFFNAFASHLVVTNKAPDSLYWHGSNDWFNQQKEGCAVNSGYPTATLADGAMIYLTSGIAGNYNLLIDVNGKKPPNMVGRDIFGMTVFAKEGVIKPNGGYKEQCAIPTNNASNCYQYPISVNEPCDKTHIGWGCSATKLYE